MRQRGAIVIGLISLTATAMLLAPTRAGSALLVWNASPSAPAGLYAIDRKGWRLGDRVAVLPSQALASDLDRRHILSKGKLLIKRIVAMAGDTICRQGEEVSLNGRIIAHAQAVDSANRPLPSWQGCVSLSQAQVFLLGDTAGSYDGRYFGVTSVDGVLGRAVMLAAF